MEKNKEASYKESLALAFRAIRLLYKAFPQFVVSLLAYQIWNAITPYIGIYFSAQIIGELTGAKAPRRLELLVLLALGAAAVASLITALLKRWYNTHEAGFWFYKTGRIFAGKMLDMDFANLDRTETSDALNTILQNQNNAGWGLTRVKMNMDTACGAIGTILGGIVLSVSLFATRVPESAGAYTVLNNPIFVILMVGMMLLITYISQELYHKVAKYWAENADSHRMGNRLFSFWGFLGLKAEMAADMRMYSQAEMCERFTGDKGGIFSSNGIFAKYSRGKGGFLTIASAAVAVVYVGIVYGFVCLKAWAGAFGLGAVTQYIAAITQTTSGISSLFSVISDTRNDAVFLQQVFAFLDMPNEMYQGSLTVEKRRDRKYEVEFRDVSFKYPGSKTYALSHVNMKFEIGKRVAVVGMNGSGKTTFIKLLCRLYDPTEGEILLNGIDIRKYNYAEYMMIFSVVFQDFSLFALTLAENVATGETYERARVLDCLDKAGFSDRLDSLPDGIDTYLYKDYNKDGINVSGGEAQKIAIARTLYKDAPFIILDEPTAALDPIAEAEIYEKFNEIVGDKTAIYISHRLSSCKFCDEILVFDEGAVIQQGSHEALVADHGGKYYELWQAQAQYYTA